MNCNSVWTRLQEIRILLRNSRTLNQLKDTLYDSVHQAITTHKRNPGPLVLLMELWESTWKERNAHIYSSFLGRLPSWVILKSTADHLKAMLEDNRSRRKARQLQQNVDELEFILKPWANLKIPGALSQSDAND